MVCRTNLLSAADPVLPFYEKLDFMIFVMPLSLRQ